MNLLNKITFQNIAKGSIMSFVYFLFPLIALMLFYNPAMSILGLLFSYISIVGVIAIMNILIFSKDKFVFLVNFVSEKINQISNEKTSNIVKNSIKVIVALVSLLAIYLLLHFGNIFLGYMSLVSVLNPVMIVVLNIYYIVMALVFTSYNG